MMDEFYSCFLQNALAFTVGLLFFILTLFLVSKKMIHFTFSLILMLMAVGATIGIKNQDIVISYWHHYVSHPVPSESSHPMSSDSH